MMSLTTCSEVALVDWISISSSLLKLKDEPKPSFNQVPLFVSHTLTSDRQVLALLLAGHAACRGDREDDFV